jgi:hypothetical protein
VPDRSLLLLKTDPLVDALRDDPRFTELLPEMNLAQNNSQLQTPLQQHHVYQSVAPRNLR